MARWFVRLLALLATLLRQRLSRAASLSPATPEWAICCGCATALTDSVYRFDDASYCAACHDEVELQTSDSDDE